MNDRNEAMDAADELWLDHALTEAARSELPPDLRASVLAAGPARLAAAAVRVDAAAPVRTAQHWLAVALAVVGLAVVIGVLALRGSAPGSRSAQSGQSASENPAVQDPAREIAVGDAAALAQLLPRLRAVAMVARSGPDGARLPDAPEHSGLVLDPALVRQIADALGSAAMVGEAIPLAEAPAELVLQLEDHRCVRGRLRFDGEKAAFGTAAFSLPDVLPREVAGALRQQWQALAAAKAPARQKIQVQTMRQLIAAIGSDRTIELMGGPFVLAPADDDGELPVNPAAVFRSEWGSTHLEIHGVHNLHLRSIGGASRVLSSSPTEVIAFVDCQGVWCENLVLGHVEGLVLMCSAPVVTLRGCRSVVLRGCELFGCGTMGVIADDVQGFALDGGEVHTCRHGALQFRNCTGAEFRATVFRDCAMAPNAFAFADCRQIAFRQCAVRGMTGADGEADVTLFEVRMDEPVEFLGGSIVGNRCQRVANSKLLLDCKGTEQRDNGPDVVVPAAPDNANDHGGATGEMGGSGAPGRETGAGRKR